MDLRSPLARVKGLGSAKHGSGHWLAQRFSAVALIPLVIWFVYVVLTLVTGGGTSFVALLSSPVTTVLLVLFIGTMLYHGTLGIQVVVEDYVTCHVMKTALIIGTRFAAIATVVAFVMALVSANIVFMTLK